MKKTISVITAVLLLLSFLFLFNSFSITRYANNAVPAPEKKEVRKKPNDWFYLQRSYPYKYINYTAWREAIEQAEIMRKRAVSVRTSWQPAGPTNIGGRITALAAHPSNPQRVFAGAADGGLWRTTNGGASWQPVFDFNHTLSIGAIAVDPQNADILYVGTGEANASGDSYPGNGIFKSTDGGDSWQQTGLTESYYIGRIAINPQNSQQIFVAATGLLFGKNPQRGIYRSNDGGLSWQNVLFISDSTAAIDVVINPVNPAIVYAAMWERIRYPNQRQAGGITSGIYKSTDGGGTWNLLSNGLPAASATTGRIGLSISQTNPEVLYAIYANHPGYFMGIYKTTNGGTSWSRVNDGALSSMYSSFGWYFGNIYVDPTNANTVYALGLRMYKSTNGGNSWVSVANSTHVDHHAIWVNPSNPQNVIIGNDGGIFISQNGGSSFSKVFELPVTQFYAATVDFNNPQRLYGGTQDNGTMRTLTGNLNDWSVIYGGDGFYVIVDPTNSNIIYAESQYGGLGKSTNGGSSFFPVTSGINGNDRRNWMTPVVMDPNNPSVLYYGTYRVYKTGNGASNWAAISGDLSNGPYPGGLQYGTITTMAVAPSNSNVIYAGTDDGNVWVTMNGGMDWNNISAQLPLRWVMSIAVDPFDENKVVTTFSGYKYGQYIGHVFRTNNAGQTWVDISANLPQAPVNKIVIDPDYPNIFYVGSDVGVYVTSNAGVSWNMLGENLPAAVVMDLTLHSPTRTLAAATHGRSMFKIDVSTVVNISAGDEKRPREFRLNGVYPNPFNSETVVEFQLEKPFFVDVTIFDMLGRLVKVLNRKNLAPGNYKIRWDGINSRGLATASGNYLVRVVAGPHQATRLISLVK